MKSGLITRSKILDVLDRQVSAAGEVAKARSLSYGVVMHHLRLLEAEGTVSRRGSRPYSWLLTGKGQKRLVS